MKNIVVVGSSGHAKVIIDIIEKENKYTIVGLLDKFKKTGDKILGYEIIGKEDELLDLQEKYFFSAGIIAVGDNWMRQKICQELLRIDPSFEFISTRHPSSQVARDVQIGAGTCIMAGVAINTNSQVGNHCILNTNSSLDHDCVMGDFSSIAPGSTTGGNVKIGKLSAISLGAVVAHGVEVANECVIGAGAVVLKNIPVFSVAYGVPAKIIRKRKSGEKYL